MAEEFKIEIERDPNHECYLASFSFSPVQYARGNNLEDAVLNFLDDLRDKPKWCLEHHANIARVNVDDLSKRAQEDFASLLDRITLNQIETGPTP